MSSVSETSRTLSSLEEMLEALKQRDESEMPKDCPPALPFRPKLASRTRPPSPKRSMPGTPEKREIELENGKREEEFKGKLGNVFGAKMCKEVDSSSESPYVNSSAQKEYRQRFWENDGAKLDNKLPYSLPKFREDEWDDNISYFIEKKLRVWCHLKNRQWEPGQVQSTSGDKASVLLSDGSVVAVPVEELLPANPDILQGVDDLVQLCYLNEPSVLHNLQYRYVQDRIYTKAGPVLIAVNPFKEIQLYGSKLVTAYKKKLLDSPHIYSIAETAYSQMMEDEMNQSIIISGESGSGKTETAKSAIEYLVMISGGSNHVESELLQTSCLLEAFGNAKTLRNNNSSRFGRLIEIYFSAEGGICGANVQAFLLEKSRVVQLAHGERSYHIFYQLCAGAPSALRDKLKLKGASEYNFLNQSNSLVIHNVDDAKKFHMLVKALNTAGISERDQEHAFQMVAAVLWLGNITFQAIGNGNNVEVVQCEAIINAASLMGCSANDLMLALSTRKIQAGKDKVVKSLTMQQAIDTRDAMAKFIYANLFDWIVDKINRSLAMGKEKTGRSINILDIYGFESFEKNSFEQFCINYANERLQQHCYRHLFKLEQEEYELDGIDWTKVDFQDNQECLDLFEKKPIGIISLLDEESNFDKATDLAFANKLKQHLKANPCYRGDREEFGIRHYAGEVIYDTSGFLNKNRDTVHPDTIQLLSSSSEDLLKLFASSFANQSKKTASSIHIEISDFQKQTVATKFKDVLFKLMQQLESTAPHFICCIKPNNKQVPGMYNNDLVFEQLRSYSLLEVVRISRSGYPTRMTHQEFCIRYGVLLPEDHERKDPLSMSVSILRQFDILTEMYQVGYTKLYFRAGQDQIEAPVWVDLTLECKSAYKDMDDEWFHISHPFHQASSRELKSAFSRSGESSINLEHDMQGSSSPKLPPSVSRSRGKDFRSRQWSQGDQTLTLDKKHPVKHLSKGGLEADRVVEHKTNHKKLTSSAAIDSDSACQALNSRDKKISSNSLAVYSDKTRSISSSITSEHGEECYKQELCVSDSSSTITSEACGKKSFEVSGPVLGQTTGLLSSLRVSLRKSCVTRQASRMEVNVCRQSEGRKSSSSKSSVGSSSIPYKEREGETERESKEKTPDSRNVTTIVEAKLANKSKVPVQAHNRTSIPKMVTGRSVSSSVPTETNRPKVHLTNVQRKALVPQRANGRVASILVSKPSERIGSSHCRRVVSSGKENAVVKMGMSQKSVAKDNQGCSTKFSSYKNENKRSCQSTKSSGFMVNLDNRKEVPNRANVKKKAFY